MDDFFDQIRGAFVDRRPFDFTFPLTDAIAARGTDTTHEWTDTLMRGQRRFSRFSSLYPHSITHLHLPWAVDWEPLRQDMSLLKRTRIEDSNPQGAPDEATVRYTAERRKALALIPDDVVLPPPAESAESREKISSRTKPAIWRCLVLDFSDKLSTLVRFAERQPDRFVSLTPTETLGLQDLLLSSTVKTEDLNKLLVDLCISGEDIEERLRPHLTSQESLRDTAVIFHTSWNHRLRPTGDRRYLASQLLECWHPYLLHPFLDASATELLHNAGIAALGSDTYGFECPLYYANRSYGFPAVRALAGVVESGEGTLSSDDRQVILPPYPAIHLRFAGTDVQMIENMRIDPTVFSSGLRFNSLRLRLPNQSAVIRGVLGVFPLATTSPLEEALSCDFLLAKVYFWAEQDGT